MLRISWLERLPRDHHTKLVHTSDDEIGEGPSRSSRGGADYDLYGFLQGNRVRHDNVEMLPMMCVQRDVTDGSDHPGPFPADMVSKSFQELNNFVHESSTMLSKCRFDIADGTEELMA